MEDVSEFDRNRTAPNTPAGLPIAALCAKIATLARRLHLPLAWLNCLNQNS